MRQFIATAVCLLLAGCATGPLHMKSAGYTFAFSAREIGVWGHSREWPLDDSLIVRLEQKIGLLFHNPDERMRGTLSRDGLPPRSAPFPLSEYFIRYCGVIKDGKKQIVGKATHQSQDGRRTLSRPKEDEVIVLWPSGGGTFFFTVTFDPDTNRILDLSYNAPL